MTRAVEARSESAPSGRSERAAARAVPAFIAGARECFDRSGYVGTRIEDIAAAANYAVGSFYTYFSSKEEVLLTASRATDTAVPSEDRSTAASAAPRLVQVLDRVEARCVRRLGLDTAMEQAALRSRPVLDEWRLDRARAVGSVSDALRQARLEVSLSDDELATVSSALLSMSEQSLRLELEVDAVAVLHIWEAAFSSALVEATPLTGRIDPPTDSQALPLATGSKDRLLAAANSLLTAESWDSVSVARIAEAAGVANGTFYRHFTSKAEVLAALIDSAPLLPPATRGVSLSFADEVFHLVVAHFDGVHRCAGLWSSVAEAVGAEALVHDALGQARRRWLSSVGEVVRDWQRSGEVAAGVDLATVVPLLAAMLEREAFLVAVVERAPDAIYGSAATVRDCWWRALTSS